MQMQEIVDKFKKIIADFGFKSNVEKSLCKVIEEYNRENPAEFFEAFTQLVLDLSAQQEDSSKAVAYDKIVGIENKYSERIQKLKQQFYGEINTEQVDADALPYSTES